MASKDVRKVFEQLDDKPDEVKTKERIKSFMFDNKKGRAIITYKDQDDAAKAIYEFSVWNPFPKCPKFSAEWYEPDKKLDV